MLSDRPYMRGDYPRQSTSVITWLIAATVAMFALQCVFQIWLGAGGQLERMLGLSPGGFRAGRVWSLLSYGLLHDSSFLLHIVGNLLGLFFLGRILEPLLGARRFLGLYAGSIVLGGLLWLAAHWQGGAGVLIGASAGVAGLFVVFACFYPNQPITFLLLFFIPVTLKPKVAALALAAVELGGFFYYEIMGAVSPFSSPIAHSAHLGGMAAGWIYYRYVHEAQWRLSSAKADIQLPRWMQKRASAASPKPAAARADVPAKSDLRHEVDRILDKINSHGFGSLTPDEKRVLSDAKDLLSRR
jgi:membrane associated rhomboid family serine protease